MYSTSFIELPTATFCMDTRMDRWMDRQTYAQILPVFYRTLSPSGPQPCFFSVQFAKPLSDPFFLGGGLCHAHTPLLGSAPQGTNDL